MTRPTSESPMARLRRAPSWVNLMLYLTTFATTFGTWFLFFGGEGTADAVVKSLTFMAALMGILTAHEAGHYVMARRNKVDASLPFFIPYPPNPILPSFLGTFGALIFMGGRIRSRDALMEVGAAGPVAGMVVTVILLFWGLADCPVVPIPEEGFVEGQSLLYVLAKRIMVGPIPEGHDILVDRAPLVWAAWAGMLVTALNLLPIGQLDGGHVFYALFGERHGFASRLFHKGLFLLGVGVSAHGAYGAYSRGLPSDGIVSAAVTGTPWLFLGLLLWVLHRKRGFNHPPTDDDRLSPTHRLVGFLCILILIVTFMPVVMTPVG